MSDTDNPNITFKIFHPFVLEAAPLTLENIPIGLAKDSTLNVSIERIGPYKAPVCSGDVYAVKIMVNSDVEWLPSEVFMYHVDPEYVGQGAVYEGVASVSEMWDTSTEPNTTPKGYMPYFRRSEMCTIFFNAADREAAITSIVRNIQKLVNNLEILKDHGAI